MSRGRREESDGGGIYIHKSDINGPLDYSDPTDMRYTNGPLDCFDPTDTRYFAQAFDTLAQLYMKNNNFML